MVCRNWQYSWDISSVCGIERTIFLAFFFNVLLPIHANSVFQACLIGISWGLLIHKFSGSTWTYLTRILRDLRSLVVKPAGPLIGSEQKDTVVTTLGLLLPRSVEEISQLSDITTLSHTWVLLATLLHMSPTCKPSAEKPKDTLIKVSPWERWFSHICVSMRYFYVRRYGIHKWD